MQKSFRPKREIVQIFEIVGSHFVSVFYNGLYRRAVVDTRAGKYPSITDGYRRVVSDYVLAITDTNKYCSTEICEIYGTYQKYYHGGIAETFEKFEGRFLGAIIPREFYNSLINTDKDVILRDVVVKTVAELADSILSPEMIRRIVDDHQNHYHVSELQGIAYDILCLRRDEYYSKFAQEVIREKVPGKNNMDDFNKLRAGFAAELQQRLTAESDLKKAKSVIVRLANTTRAFQDEIQNLKAEVQELKLSAQQRPPERHYSKPHVQPQEVRVDDSPERKSPPPAGDMTLGSSFEDESDEFPDNGFGH